MWWHYAPLVRAPVNCHNIQPREMHHLAYNAWMMWKAINQVFMRSRGQPQSDWNTVNEWIQREILVSHKTRILQAEHANGAIMHISCNADWCRDAWWGVLAHGSSGNTCLQIQWQHAHLTLNDELAVPALFMIILSWTSMKETEAGEIVYQNNAVPCHSRPVFTFFFKMLKKIFW